MQRRLLSTLLIVSTTILLYGCHPLASTKNEYTVPLTADAFVNSIVQNNMTGVHNTQIVSRNYLDVVKAMDRFAYRCLDVRVRHSPIGGIKSKVAYTDVTSTMNQISNQYAQLSIQGKPNMNRPVTVPPKGYYVLVANLHKLTVNKTKLDIYASGVGIQAISALKRAAQQEKVTCPTLRIASMQ